MHEVIISVKNIGISYHIRKSLFRHEKYEVLKDLSFDIKRGETVGIIGRNGAGKSTLLKLLGGIFNPDIGVIENRSTKTSLLSLQVGFDEHLSGQDNAVISGMLLGYNKEYINTKLDEIKNYSELGDFFYRPIKMYSLGMKARLGFAAAINFTPEVLLLDEVLGVGDERFREKSTESMAKLIKSDHTVVLVSHSMWVMTELCDRLLWIENGLLQMQGNSFEVYDAYQQASR
jgi:lipopolysaccharide transport system ATP-binding protein